MSKTSWVQRALCSWVPGLIVSIIFFTWYLSHLAPSLLTDDQAELQVLSQTPGIAHSMGYPLYLLVSHLAIRLLPWGDAAYRVNFLSAFFAFISLFELYCLAFKWIKAEGVARIAGALTAIIFFGFSYTFSWVSLVANMYTLQLSLFLLMLLVAKTKKTQHFLYFYGIALLFGIMFGIHTSAVQWLPVFAYLVITDPEPEKRKPTYLLKIVICMTTGVALGHVLPFLALWHRQTTFDFWHKVILSNAEQFPSYYVDPRSFWSCWWFSFSNAQFQHFLVETRFLGTLFEICAFPIRFITELTPIAIIAVAWAWNQGNTLRKNHGILGVLLISSLVFSVLPGWKAQVYQLPAYAIASLLIGAFFASWIKWWMPGGRASAQRVVLGLILTATIIFSDLKISSQVGAQGERLVNLAKDKEIVDKIKTVFASATHARPNYHGDFSAIQFARAVFDQVPPDALLFAPWKWVYALEYLKMNNGGTHRLCQILEIQPVSEIPGRPLSKKYQSLIYGRKSPIYFVQQVPAQFEKDVKEISPNLWRLD